MTSETPVATDRPLEQKRPSLVRYGMLGAIAAGAVGVENSIIEHVQYGFSGTIGGAPVQLTVDACFVVCLAGLGMVIGAVTAAVLRLATRGR